MKLGVLTAVFGDRELAPALDAVVRCGLETVELGTGAYPGDAHCRPSALLADPAALAGFEHELDSRGLSISALACHGNPLHPDQRIAEEHRRVFRDAVELASRLGVDRLTLFSGCPGDGPGALRPNWVTCAWPPEYLELLEWQWEKVVVPYWREAAAFAADRGVHRLCFEMHPGFVVYTPATLLRLREAVGPEVGANFDPSHLVWQGIDIPQAIAELGAAGALFHVHAKDTALNVPVVQRRGVLDTTPLERIGERAWAFRTVGYGHDAGFWRAFVSALRLAGYDDVVSIEHEDALAAPEEGVRKAVALLRDCIFTEPPATPWWTG